MVYKAGSHEPDNSPDQAYVLPVNFTGNTATVNTQGSNCHTGEDYDFYRIDLDPGFTYNISANLFDYPTSSQYSLDAIYSYSFEGGSWSDTDEDYIDNPIILNDGGIVYFFISPKYTGATGTYKLEIYLTRNPLGIEESSIGDRISIYPNPVKDFFTIDLSAFNGIAEEIQLMNLLGNYTTGPIPVDHKQKVEIAVGNLPEGIYFLCIRSDNGIIVKEIVIRR